MDQNRTAESEASQNEKAKREGSQNELAVIRVSHHSTQSRVSQSELGKYGTDWGWARLSLAELE